MPSWRRLRAPTVALVVVFVRAAHHRVDELIG